MCIMWTTFGHKYIVPSVNVLARDGAFLLKGLLGHDNKKTFHKFLYTYSLAHGYYSTSALGRFVPSPETSNDTG